jgi:hypothetical protein
MSEQPSEERRDDEVGTSLPGMIADMGRDAGSSGDDGHDPDAEETPDHVTVGRDDAEADAERSGADPGAV